ncbi:hypothetical protein K7472_04070 [Streptomyces sp. PTM05]|uniref:Carbamoyltransferase n=1 Tax=Streptantibioticus parmotrematis TaxID=2873249 RepID=A0ABS7QLF2_9ACTN|nr:carbamoyltransferase C-terminal domain-containing protein [Streptantibioticus parmotrematis]MBY8884019.1 hypothetical protein [Streptantibioticus parmotrematis]
MPYVLGLGGPYRHDASACLVDETGQIVAFAEEERFSRRRWSAGTRKTSRSVSFCLDRAGIGLADVDDIVAGFVPRWLDGPAIRHRRLIRQTLEPRYFDGHQPVEVSVIGHHLAHAASAFHCSGFDRAAVLVVDGAGDGAATSLYRGTPDGLELVEDYPFNQSLGLLYESAAGYLGLGDLGGADKLMALAAYGEPRYDLGFLTETASGYAIDLSKYGMGPRDTGGFRHVTPDWSRRMKECCRAAYAALGVPERTSWLSYDRASGGFSRCDDFTPEQADLAASMQAALERCLLSLARRALAASGTTRLCLAGDVALNCAANGVLQRYSGATELFVQPAADDAGIAIGAALEVARQRGYATIPSRRMTHIAFGPDFSDEGIGRVLDETGARYTHHGDAVVEAAATALADGSVIGWFQGRAEGGPRALGRRSILGDPRSVTTRDRMNRDIKRREWWRPLGLSVHADAAGDLVLTPSPGSTDFMAVAHYATETARTRAPAAVHVDDTLRPQVVTAAADDRYARLLHAFGARTGVLALVNASFNDESEPIVCSPADALRMFWSSPMDALAIGGFWLDKRR